MNSAKFSLIVLAVAVCGLAVSSADAKTNVKTNAKHKKPVIKTAQVSKSPRAASKSLSRDVVFDGSYVNGRYHSAGEAVAKVETEKQLNDLIGLRRDFKDRLAAERQRLKSADQAGQ